MSSKDVDFVLNSAVAKAYYKWGRWMADFEENFFATLIRVNEVNSETKVGVLIENDL